MCKKIEEQKTKSRRDYIEFFSKAQLANYLNKTFGTEYFLMANSHWKQ
jgi:hypothetical protein